MAFRPEKMPNLTHNAAAAAAAKSLQSCPTLCDAIDGSPPGSPIPGILYLLAVMISVAMNVYVQAFTWTHFRFSGT